MSILKDNNKTMEIINNESINTSDKKEKAICCDVDGVITNFGDAYRKWLSKNHPKVKINPDSYHCGVPFELGKDFVSELWRSGVIREMEHFPGAKTYFNKLAQKYDMYIVTAINPNYSVQRTKNLKGYGYKSLTLIHKRKTDWIINDLKPDIAIEDKPANIKTLSEAGIDVYYPIYVPYTNDMEDYGTPFNSWKHLWELLK
jgi:5'(3')-deoxyribonucleotidase